ncbi:oxalate/formate MFS antiporter [Azospirillum picis]|uniref:OFA family oxalate/formate antiporter-like MFS transporter n=1 Tax=Azospirillum picis TaxID=488438 RepID=A0ABU0MHD8_9PROT|nr:oxalate/formate MFS antiporter [Azospirillum picis]MBP2298883.1 OFA family oxalate/formate antiporter-like MFS transporter [Azospirillum picis]MDQ0532875.1 OFA family oxalate/formate antiporter-like MFS transporter [Azospirillum picis]
MTTETTENNGLLTNKWIQLSVGLVCMAMIANLQYGWTLFVDPIDAKHGWGRAAIQIAFSVFVFTETWLVPVEGWFVDRYGPQVVVLVGSLLVGASWVIDSMASSLAVLYTAAVVAGIGAGCVYGTCVGNALKWFPHQRGLAAGITAAGFGAGAAATVIPIANMIASAGYEHAFLVFGIGQGAVIFLMSFFLRKAPKTAGPARKSGLMQTKVDHPPGRVIRTPVFWLLYVMFVMVASGGLMAAAQIAPIAHDFHVAESPIALFGMVLPALTLAISLDRVLDGAGRPFFGWVSDRIGRENTMFIAFGTAAVAIILVTQLGRSPVLFVAFTALFFCVFGEIYSLFPATAGDTFGSKFAATNAGMLYTAKGTAALLVPVSSLIAAHFGWAAVFYIAASFNLVAAILALFVLKPLRATFLQADDYGIQAVGVTADR